MRLIPFNPSNPKNSTSDLSELKMTKEIEIALFPDEIQSETIVYQHIADKLEISIDSISTYQILRQSLDARSRIPLFKWRIMVYLNGATPISEPLISDAFKQVENAKRVLIIGAGPAGYFAALELIELGLKPIVLDRGKDVRARRRDLRSIQQFGVVNPHSNYCFGEGGAGTYSDGKLYTRAHKRGNITKILKLLVEHGANSTILTEAHPHIGSNKLPNVVANIRETILKYGGEVHFDHFVTDFILEKNKIKGVVINESKIIYGEATIIATGHSARDIYQLCFDKKIRIEAKPFALGVRIEHQQSVIDQVQYKQSPRHENLPASSYSLVCQADGRGVFSFCMCPGGLVVPAATAPEEIVVNGMSMSRRDSEFANSGTVTSIEMEDLKAYQSKGVFAAMAFQRDVEKKMFYAGDGSQKAPAQRLTDFVNRKVSSDLAGTSYIPGLFSAPLHDLLPAFVYKRLRLGVMEFGKMMRGYMTENANVIGTESRTSAPVRIPRHPETLMHPEIEGFFPCGEGAGYAGGIISAAMDGQNVAKAIALYCKHIGDIVS
ncbi:MAG: hypothetical protein RIS64_1144 [Bacteroidota bacterium]